MSGPLDHARELLEKARHDLVAAGALVKVEDEILDTACFHVQQAVEKSLKSLLALDDVVYPFTHDLESLLDLAESRWPVVGAFAQAVIPMTRYAVIGRYSDILHPDREEVGAAIEVARQVYDLAREEIARRGLPRTGCDES